MKPRLIPRHCPAQGEICKAIQACPSSAVLYVVDEQERLGGRIVFDIERCDGCGKCATECCGHAIEMV